MSVRSASCRALLDGLAAHKKAGPQYIELFSGSPDDANATVFFNSATKVLKPRIDDASIVVGSGQTAIKQTATSGWKAETAQSRMDVLLTSTCADKRLDGVLSPNDSLARAIITSVKGRGSRSRSSPAWTRRPSRSSRSWPTSSTRRSTRTPAPW